jgi:hypothetical protein
LIICYIWVRSMVGESGSSLVTVNVVFFFS